ncbi:FAD-binding domain-containing protein [Tilletiaria anomala UBC 951]|uniref:FAD-binding domain-containing protein n=1 Tax=Tilletiaria anomala (strain ATCC 24038 / CBS 436.72 / UBC 951) TaxID=1037660 RepID=A0A066VS92_TILAU|nr:FAD-binding domain-containing protein [Tilletiaria anomala UBC 951]KDN41674.1 FAD-binding domain-containing protein [Tilletiaria anomala UBC 951]
MRAGHLLLSRSSLSHLLLIFTLLSTFTAASFVRSRAPSPQRTAGAASRRDLISDTVENILHPVIHFAPTVLGISINNKGLQLDNGTNPNDPVQVSQALQTQPPPIDLGQLLQDITPNYNTSKTLDSACSAIHTALPNNDYVGRVCTTPECIQSTTHYYNARQAGNRPACVTYPTSSQDVVTIMKLLREYDVTYAIKAVGHSTGYNFTTALGFSSTTGILIDMSKMKAVSYDASTGIARWEPGQSWGELATTMAQYGAQVVGGRLGAVGPGLSFGGGISWYSGQVGFASDTTHAFEIVLADGTFIIATQDNQYSDLWWAAKVGMNSFGIITAVHSRTLPGTTTYGGSVIFPTDKMLDVLGAYANWINGGADKCKKGFVLPAITDFFVESLITRLNIFEFFFDGTDPGECFKDFNIINTLYDDRKVQPYPDFLNKALTNQQFVFSGFNNALYSSVTDLINKDQLLAIYNAWEEYSVQTSGAYLQNTLSFSVITKTGLAASQANGGNAMGVSGGDGYLWVCYAEGSIPAIGALMDTKLFGLTPQAAQAVPKSQRKLPLYANYARLEQKPFLTYGGIELLRQIKKKYDPDNFISSHTTGHDFY